MAASPRPAPAVIVITLMAAAVIGFLVGALLATTSEPDAAPDSSPVSTAAATPPPTATGTPAPTASVDATLSLDADRDTADTGELIQLTGVLVPAQGDVELQVQQSVDGIGFVDFPVTATTRTDGSFAVKVRTGRVGSNEFRVVTDVDGTQVVSNSVVVAIS
ncbi:MAG: hypothetical protein WCA82_16310 [Jiangellales bacterium]